jgi:hypothetical protein
MKPFSLNVFKDISDNPDTGVFEQTDPVPLGSTFVVEHISGYLVVKENEKVDRIYAYTPDGKQNVYLPVHFASRVLSYGNELPAAVAWQFGSPARMYGSSGETLVIRGEAVIVGRIFGCFVGYLEP